MAKKINFGEINETSMELLSKYHVATLELRALAEVHKNTIKELTEKKDAIIANFNIDREAGLPLDECKQKWSTVEVDKAINVENDAYKEKCKPHKESVKSALALVPDEVYDGYTLSQEKGELSKLTTTIQAFLNSIGVYAPDTATTKFAQIMATRTAGSRKANAKKWAEGHYITEKSARQYKDLFMLAFLEYVITEKGVVDVCEDGSLKMHQF